MKETTETKKAKIAAALNHMIKNDLRIVKEKNNWPRSTEYGTIIAKRIPDVDGVAQEMAEKYDIAKNDEKKITHAYQMSYMTYAFDAKFDPKKIMTLTIKDPADIGPAHPVTCWLITR